MNPWKGKQGGDCGATLSWLSENTFVRLVVYYILINYFLINNMW